MCDNCCIKHTIVDVLSFLGFKKDVYDTLDEKTFVSDHEIHDFLTRRFDHELGLKAHINEDQLKDTLSSFGLKDEKITFYINKTKEYPDLNSFFQIQLSFCLSITLTKCS